MSSEWETWNRMDAWVKRHLVGIISFLILYTVSAIFLWVILNGPDAGPSLFS